MLPAGCGTPTLPGTEGAIGGGAGPAAPDALRRQCAEVQNERRTSQRPFELVYAKATGRDGADGYYRLVSGTGDHTRDRLLV